MTRSDESNGDEASAYALEELTLDPRCPRCNYDLSGTLESGKQQCPECGYEWTVEELARQFVARTRQRRGFELFIWVFAPGPIICLILFMGLVFGHLVWWMALVGAIGYAGIMLVDWIRGLHNRSLIHGRTAAGRLVYVASGLIALVAINLAEVIVALFILRVIQNVLIGGQ